MAKKTCPHCKKEFTLEKFIATTAFCSRKCQRAFNAAKRNKKESEIQQEINAILEKNKAGQ